MIKKVITERVIQETRDGRFSDFSGVELPQNMDWSARTKIWCTTSDHGRKGGNTIDEFELDLMPEEMCDFRHELQSLIRSMKEKYSKRQTRPAT